MVQEADVRIYWGIRIPMRDGIQLVGDLYLPPAGVRGKSGITASKPTNWSEAWPAIVVRTPYGRNTDAMIEQGRWFAAHGYAVVQVDVRGRGDSEGVFVPYRSEGKDGYDVIEWVAAQPWCTGAVGTLGASYLARIQWLTALQHPPHLKAMISVVTPSDPFVEWPTGVPSPMHLCWLFMTADRVMQNMRHIDWRRVYEHLPLNHDGRSSGTIHPSVARGV